MHDEKKIIAAKELRWILNRILESLEKVFEEPSKMEFYMVPDLTGINEKISSLAAVLDIPPPIEARRLEESDPGFPKEIIKEYPDQKIVAVRQVLVRKPDGEEFKPVITDAISEDSGPDLSSPFHDLNFEHCIPNKPWSATANLNLRYACPEWIDWINSVWLSSTSDSSQDVKKGKQSESIVEENLSENSFIRKGDYWAITYKGNEINLENLLGIRVQAYLLIDHPDEAVDCETILLFCSGTTAETLANTETKSDLTLEDNALSQGSTKVDNRRKEAVSEDKEILLELLNACQEAKERGDYREQESLEKEYQKKLDDIGKKKADLASENQKKKKSQYYRVRNSLTQAWQRISNFCPDLGDHLMEFTKTGEKCTYKQQSELKWKIIHLPQQR